MKKILVLGGAAIGSVAMMTLGGGVASADDVVGQKYSEAQSALSAQGLGSQVASTIGGRKDLGDCIVTSAHAAPTVDGYGNRKTGTMLVNLDCGGK
ncbi:MAG: hypothetical protein QOI33_879 [Mycobacterium sp.]|nr:hypothetical protein [Mycobacterium sp.]